MAKLGGTSWDFAGSGKQCSHYGNQHGFCPEILRAGILLYPVSPLLVCPPKSERNALPLYPRAPKCTAAQFVTNESQKRPIRSAADEWISSCAVRAKMQLSSIAPA